MPGWEMKIITAEAQRLLAMAVEDAGLREELRALAEDDTEGDRGLSAPDREGDGSANRRRPDRPRSSERRWWSRCRELTLGRSRVAPTAIPQAPVETAPAVVVTGSRSRRDRIPLPAQGESGAPGGGPSAPDS